MTVQFNSANLLKASAVLLSSVALFGNKGCNRADLYNPTANEYQLQFLGDSYIDFGSGKKGTAYIPLAINQYATGYYGETIVYKDRSVTGATLEEVQEQYEDAKAHALADDSYEIQTIVVNGGANNIREACKTEKIPDGYEGTNCETLMDATEITAKAFIDQLTTEVPNVIWMGRYYMAPFVTLQSVIDDFDNTIKAYCESKANCFYMDPRYNEDLGLYGLWNYDDAVNYVLNDGKHVNPTGGELIAAELWSILTQPGWNIYF